MSLFPPESHTAAQFCRAGQEQTLMANDNEKGTCCKDGKGAVNEGLSKLLEAFDKLGFRVLKLETNSLDYDLKIRLMRTDDKD